MVFVASRKCGGGAIAPRSLRTRQGGDVREKSEIRAVGGRAVPCRATRCVTCAEGRVLRLRKDCRRGEVVLVKQKMAPASERSL